MAQWVEFLSDFPWHVPEFKGRVTKMYRAGTKRFVKDDCAEKAIARGRAKACESPRAVLLETERAAEVQDGETIAGDLEPREWIAGTIGREFPEGTED